MRDDWDNNNFSRHKRRKKAKRRTLHRSIKLFLILCCCLTVMMLVIGLFANNFPIAKDKQPDAPLTDNAVINTDFNISSTPDTQRDADETAWCLILVNKWNYIPDDYEVELTELTNGESVDKQIYPALQEMFDAARSDGVYPVVVSGYRTADEQQSLMEEKIAAYKAEGCSDEEAINNAEAWVAIPGTSEHQLGIAVDINEDGIHSTSDEVYGWLDQNACKFGFIRRYPPDKTEITGVISEPWHYRYVGVDAAAEIYNQGICFEEYK